VSRAGRFQWRGIKDCGPQWLDIWCSEYSLFGMGGKFPSLCDGLADRVRSQCFISIPALVFLIMTPRYDKTRKFANVNAMLVVDLFMSLIWLSAFATQADYNTQGLCGKVCGLSKAVVGLGVFVT
jgi:hypothetical protein